MSESTICIEQPLSEDGNCFFLRLSNFILAIGSFLLLTTFTLTIFEGLSWKEFLWFMGGWGIIAAFSLLLRLPNLIHRKIILKYRGAPVIRRSSISTIFPESFYWTETELSTPEVDENDYNEMNIPPPPYDEVSTPPVNQQLPSRPPSYQNLFSCDTIVR